MDHYLTTLLALSMGISVIEDIRRMKIPNLVTFSTMLLAVSYHFISGGIEGLFFSFGGLLSGIGFFIIPYIMGGMGAGDVKLMGAAGAILGPKGVCAASVLVILAGGVYGIILFAIYPRYAVSFIKRLWAMLKTLAMSAQFILIPPAENEKQPILRYAIPIAIGTMSYLAIEMNGHDLFAQLFGFHFSIFSS
jgi:prepilin peptidase CpaA